MSLNIGRNDVSDCGLCRLILPPPTPSPAGSSVQLRSRSEVGPAAKPGGELWVSSQL